jgi:hypothetical protein
VLQNVDRQSVSTTQLFVSGHAGAQSAVAVGVQAPEGVPPQSTSVSPPFFTPSVGVGRAQVNVPGVHTRLWQSLETRHFFVAGHAGALSLPG